MEKVTDEQREAIKKASNERLRVKLLQHGMAEENVFALDRKQLMEAVAEVVLQAQEGISARENTGESEMKALKERELELKAGSWLFGRLRRRNAELFGRLRRRNAGKWKKGNLNYGS
jgi:hypothetical protein